VPVFARLYLPVRLPWRVPRRRLTLTGPGNIRVMVRVSFTTGAVQSAILATAGLLAYFYFWFCDPTLQLTENDL